MNVRFSNGLETVPVDIPDNWINGRCYRSFGLEEIPDPASETRISLASPVGRGAMETLAGKSVCVAVDPSSDCVLHTVLPALLEDLEERLKADPKRVTVLIAGSIWNPVDQEHARRQLPEYAKSTFKLHFHDPAESDLEEVGVSTTGVPMMINRLWTQADVRITVGHVTPDLVMGFAGGRSIVMPGLAGVESARALFSYSAMSSESVGYGVLRDNPAHLAAIQTMEASPAHLAVCVVVNRDGNPAHILAGDPGQTFVQAVAFVREKMQLKLKEPMDIIVTTGGGAPHDSTILALVEALSAVAPALKPDGTIVISAHLGEGFGPAPLRHLLLNSGGPRGFSEKYGDGSAFRPGQWVAQHLFRILANHEVIVHAPGMEEDDLWAAGLTPTDNLQEAVEVAMQGHGQRCKIAALPDGPFSLPQVATEAVGAGTRG